MSILKVQMCMFVLGCMLVAGCSSDRRAGARRPNAPVSEESAPIGGSAPAAPEALPPPPTPTDIVLFDTLKVLKDGEGWIWKLEPGKYELEMTASDDGVTAEWIGGNCAKTQPMRQMTMTCVMTVTGQLVLNNPTVFGLGKSASVTAKLTKFAE